MQTCVLLIQLPRICIRSPGDNRPVGRDGGCAIMSRDLHERMTPSTPATWGACAVTFALVFGWMAVGLWTSVLAVVVGLCRLATEAGSLFTKKRGGCQVAEPNLNAGHVQHRLGEFHSRSTAEQTCHKKRV